MKYIEVLRIENQMGHGFYSYGSTPMKMHEEKHCPNPYQDERLKTVWDELYNKSDYSFGFRNERQMRAWFRHPQWRKQVEEQGFHIYVYSVPEADVRYGDKQVIFKKHGRAFRRQGFIRLTQLGKAA